MNYRIPSYAAFSRYAPGVLLALGLCLQGAKTPLMFFIWGSSSLGLCVWAFMDRPALVSKSSSPLTLLVLALTAVAFMASLDSVVSLFQTLQILAYIAVWLLLRSHPKGVQGRFFWRLLMVLGMMTLFLTLYQIKAGPAASGLFKTHGFLPTNPSFNAIWMASLSAAFIARAFRRGRFSSAEDKIELILGILFALLVVFNPARTRSAPLALCIALPYVFCIRYSVKRVVLGGVILIGLAFACLPMNFLEARARISGDHAEPNYRTQIWKAAMQAMRDHPLTGYGLGNFEMAYQKHAFPVREDFVRFSRSTQFAHNEYLHVGAELGIPAFVLMIFLIIRLLLSSTSHNPGLQQPAKAALLTLCSDALFNPTWHMPFLLYLTLLWTICLIKPKEMITAVSLPRSKRSSFWYRTGALLIFINLVGLLAFSALRSVWAAQKDWKRIVKWNPYDAAAWKELGDQMPIGSQAVNVYKRAVALSPAQSYFHEALALALEHSPHPNDLLLASQHYALALQQAPKRAHLALALGRLAYHRKDVPKALKGFETARDLEPNYWEAHLWIARCLFETDRKKTALKILKNIPQQHAQFVEHQKERLKRFNFYEPSGYEQIILSYDPKVIEHELRRFVSPK